MTARPGYVWREQVIVAMGHGAGVKPIVPSAEAAPTPSGRTGHERVEQLSPVYTAAGRRRTSLATGADAG